MKNSGTSSIFVNLLEKRKSELCLEPLNPYLLNSHITVGWRDSGDSTEAIIEPNPAWDNAKEREEELLGKVPLLKIDKENIDNATWKTLKSTAEAVASIIGMIFGGPIAAPVAAVTGLGSLAKAGEQFLNQEDLKEEYTHILHRAAVIAALKEAIVEGKITSEEVMKICKND